MEKSVWKNQYGKITIHTRAHARLFILSASVFAAIMTCSSFHTFSDTPSYGL